jgi:DNA-binding response OmpR family regulator
MNVQMLLTDFVPVKGVRTLLEQPSFPRYVEFGDLRFDLIRQFVFKGPHRIALQKRPYHLLLYLVIRSEEGATKTELLDWMYGSKRSDSQHLVEVHSYRVRTELLHAKSNVRVSNDKSCTPRRYYARLVQHETAAT